jgi:glutathione synthase/RimK-type ligase-like ATP-grasp enzyme
MHALDGFFTTAFRRIISPPLMQRAAVKPRQLSVARRVGLCVPETLITNDSGEALAFVERHGGAVVHKAMTSPPHWFIDTRLWDTSDHEHIADLGLCPTIFQQCIIGPSDVRVTVIGDQVFAARIETARGRAVVDSRLDLDAPCMPYTLPDNVESALLRLMEQLGLLFGTIDLKLTASGEHVFLEVNPQGQFLYIEILTGLPLSAAVANLLEGVCPCGEK